MTITFDTPSNNCLSFTFVQTRTGNGSATQNHIKLTICFLEQKWRTLDSILRTLHWQVQLDKFKESVEEIHKTFYWNDLMTTSCWMKINGFGNSKCNTEIMRFTNLNFHTSMATLSRSSKSCWFALMWSKNGGLACNSCSVPSGYHMVQEWNDPLWRWSHAQRSCWQTTSYCSLLCGYFTSSSEKRIDQIIDINRFRLLTKFLCVNVLELE